MMADDMTPEDAERLLRLAAAGFFRARPIFYGDVDPLAPDENMIVGFDLYRGNRHYRVMLTDLTPGEAHTYRKAVLDRISSRLSREVSPFLEADGSFRDDVTITPVYVNGRPTQIVISRPGARPLRLSARDFVGLLRALRDKNLAMLHGKIQKSDGTSEDFWMVGNKDVMEVLGGYVQQGQLPLDYFTQRGNVLVMNADAIQQPLYNKQVKMKRVKFVPRSIWGWSP